MKGRELVSGKRIYLSGVVRFKNSLIRFISEDHSYEEWNKIAESAGDVVQQIEKILEDQDRSPEDLPAPTRMAYYYIRDFQREWERKAEKAGVFTGTARELPPQEHIESSDPELRLQSIAKEMADELDFKEKVVAEFYPFTNIRITGRSRGGIYYIRVSHLMKDAPNRVLAGTVASIIAKRLGRPHKHYDDIFRGYAKTNEMMKKVEKHRTINARKEFRGEKGRYHDLREAFDRVNSMYFQGEIKGLTLTWGRRSRRVVGHYDHAKRTIVVSGFLDSKNVPGYVVEYILYHEMLHYRLRTYYKNGRRVMHSRKFKELERNFTHYERAKKKIEELIDGR